MRKAKSRMSFRPLRSECGKKVRLTLGLLAWIILIALWFTVTELKLLPPLSFPQPVKVLEALVRLWKDYDLFGNVAQSWWRIAQAFALSAVVAIRSAFAMASFAGSAHLSIQFQCRCGRCPITAFLPLSWGSSVWTK